MPASGKTAKSIALASVAVVLAHGAALLWDAEGAGPAAARVLRALTGLPVLMLGPGALVVLCFAGARRLTVLGFFSRAWLANAAVLIVGTTLLKLAGLTINCWVFYVLVVALAVAACGWLAVRGARVEIAWPGRRWAGHVAAAMVLCPIALFVARRPVVVDGQSYWPLEANLDLRRALQTRRLQDAPCRVTRGAHWRSIGERRFEVAQWPAALTIQSPSAGANSYALVWLVESHVEGVLEFTLNGRPLARRYMPPRFMRRRHPRNYPPPNLIVALALPLRPGRNELSLNVAESGAAATERRIVVTDLSGLEARAARRIFDKHYLFAPIGDVQSNLSLARNFEDHLWLHTYSYSGQRFDGGGPTISNLPFPYWVDQFALLLMGDSPMSLDVMYLGLVAAMIAILLALADARDIRSVWLAFAAMLCYGIVMRLHVEALYVHTVLTFAFLLCVRHYLRGERGWFLLAAAAVALCKGGVVLLGLLFVAGVVFLPERRRRLFVDGAIVTAACALTVAGFWLARRYVPALEAFEIEARSSDYAGRFNIIHYMWDQPWFKSRPLRLAGGKLSLLVLLVSCGLPFELFRGRDRIAWALLAVGLAFHAIVCVSDPTVVSRAAIQHPLNYFTPAAVLLFIAGLRGMKAAGKRAGWWHAAVCVLCVAGCSYFARTQYQPWPASRNRAMHGAALADFLVRRGIMRIGQGAYEPALRDGQWAARACEGLEPVADLPTIHAHALVVQAHARLMLGQREAALDLARQAMSIDGSAAKSLAGLVRRLRDDGRPADSAALSDLLNTERPETK